MENQAVAISAKDPPNGQLSFCVVLHEDGQVERIVDKRPEEYIQYTREGSVAWIDLAVKEIEKESEAIAATMGFTLTPIPKLFSGYYSGYIDSDTELGMLLPAVMVNQLDMSVRPLIILIRSNIIVTIHSEDISRLNKFSRYAATFMKKIRQDTCVDKVTLILERILDENNDRNFEYLREIEKHGDDISKQLIDENISKKVLAKSIYDMKHILIMYLDVLWATKDVIDSLQYGDADLITDDEKLLSRIGILSSNLDRHIELSEQMSNVLSSGLEVMQSIYNNQLQTMNNRFALVTAYLTVLGTAALVPNTLATIAGSGIFMDINAQPGWYVPVLIVSTVGATVLSLVWVVHVWNKKEK